MLDFYAKSGFRVLACGMKSIDNIEHDRALLESELEFQGLLIM